MKVVGFQVEIYSFIDGVQRKIAIQHVQRRRNWAHKLTQTLDQVSRTFDGFVAITIFPLINEEKKEVQREQGEQPQAAISDAESVRQELAGDFSPQEEPTIEAVETDEGEVLMRRPGPTLPGLPC